MRPSDARSLRNASRSAGHLFIDTQRALIKPRRAIPILVVAAPLVYAQAAFSTDLSAIGLAMVMVVAFTTFAPFSWRLLFPPAQRVPWAPLRLLLFVAIGGIVTFVVGYWLARVLGFRLGFITSIESNAVTATLYLVGGWGLGRDIDLEQSLMSEKERANALEREAEHAQLLAIRSHLDPHFLFNTLNAIAEWCQEDGAVAERAVLELSSMLRVVLSGVKTPAWEFAKELDLARTLLSLHRIRDPGLFSLVEEIDDAALVVPIPPMLLLPLVENAMKHGPAAGHRGEVRLEVRVDGPTLVAAIENPGAFAWRREGGEGVSMVEKRVALAYAGQGRLEIRSGAATTTRAELRVPIAGPSKGVLV